jgi:DNA-binding GntR family transcriptional regulator
MLSTKNLAFKRGFLMYIGIHFQHMVTKNTIETSNLVLPQKGSLSDHVFKFIEKKIVSAEYPAGFLLNEVKISKELSISRTPVREAIKQLEMDGLVNIVVNKGAIVVGLTDEDMNNIITIRAFLEGLCARWAAELKDEQVIQQLQEVVDLQHFYLGRNNYEQCWEVGRMFHSIIYNKSRSRHVQNLLTTYHNYIYLRMKSKIMIRYNDHPAKALAEHEEILKAIKSGDSDASEVLMSKHLAQTKIC